MFFDFVPGNPVPVLFLALVIVGCVFAFAYFLLEFVLIEVIECFVGGFVFE